MFVRNLLGVFLCAVVLCSAAVFAQQPAVTSATKAAEIEGGEPRYVKPETPEQRMERLGTAEDPGPDPDPEAVFHRFGKQYSIFKAEKRFAKYLPEVGMVRPFAQANFAYQIYQENDKYVWVWQEILDTEAILEEARALDNPWSKEHIEYFQKFRGDFEPLDLQPAPVRIRFEESSAGLPTSGSFRNGAAVADMNKDGLADLVLPPQRGPAGSPQIFLGDGKGGWKRWSIQWPRAFNYGTVVVADFDKDKNPDLAFSIHLKGVALFLGDGKGKFTEVTKGLTQPFPTRRMIATDVDADGWTDIVAITEGPVGRGREIKAKSHGHLRAYLNREKGRNWEGVNIADVNEYMGGDYLSAGKFNGDRYPDFVGASVYANSVLTLFVSDGKGRAQYDPLIDGLLVPGRSRYQATTTGRFLRGAKTDDAVVSYVRNWPAKLPSELVPTPPLTLVSGLDRLTFADGVARRTPIVRWKDGRPVAGMASGDLDGDGNLDVAYVVTGSNDLVILLGDGKGGFAPAEVLGLELPPQRTYDLIVTDLNRDKRPDIVVMFEARQATATSLRNGSVKVYLNQGPQTP
ncbi:MAG: VCBS repeat-containing protein [Acidobacteriota bacterium]|nr:VCBS repeat-containing protein [Acidobacteriota bacterium]